MDATGEHTHRFKPIIEPVGDWEYNPRTGTFTPPMQMIAGYEPCECGRTWFEHACDPIVNARAAMARAFGARPWTAYEA